MAQGAIPRSWLRNVQDWTCCSISSVNESLICGITSTMRQCVPRMLTVSRDILHKDGPFCKTMTVCVIRPRLSQSPPPPVRLHPVRFITAIFWQPFAFVYFLHYTRCGCTILRSTLLQSVIRRTWLISAAATSSYQDVIIYNARYRSLSQTVFKKDQCCVCVLGRMSGRRLLLLLLLLLLS